MATLLYDVKFILLTSASFITIFSSIAIYFCLPLLISHSIMSQIALGPNSVSYDQWRLNSIVDNVYLYNITNIEQIQSFITNQQKHITNHDRQSGSNIDIPKPIIKQVGPFVFEQEREKTNFEWFHKNETVLYDQIKRWKLLPSEDNLYERLRNSKVFHLSVPLAGTTLTDPDLAEPINSVASQFDLKLFINHTISELLFDGYPDVLLENAKATGQIDIDRFGWFFNLNNSVTENIAIYTGPRNESLNKMGSLSEINHQNIWPYWHHNNTDVGDIQNSCNQFMYASTGEFFPPSQTTIIKNTSSQKEKVDRSINLVMIELCRVFKLKYSHTYDFKGLEVDRYIADKDTFDYTSSSKHENSCYCTYNEASRLTSCTPNGMMDLYNCKKGSSMTISFPHFLYSEDDETLKPYLSSFIDSDKADKNEHQFFIDLESTLNIVVKAQIAMQFNIHYRHHPELQFSQDYKFLLPTSNSSQSQDFKDFYLPQMWVKSTAEIDEKNLINLKFLQKGLPYVTPLTTIISFIVASMLLLASARNAYNLTYGPESKISSQSSNHNQFSHCSPRLDLKYQPVVEMCQH